MPPLYDPLLGQIMAGDSPPGVPRAVVRRARYLGHLIPCARLRSTIAGIGGELYQVPDGGHAVRINARWLLTFDWDPDLSRAHSLALDRI